MRTEFVHLGIKAILVTLNYFGMKPWLRKLKNTQLYHYQQYAKIFEKKEGDITSGQGALFGCILKKSSLNLFTHKLSWENLNILLPKSGLNGI